MKRTLHILPLMAALMAAPWLLAQDNLTDKVNVDLTDPTKPCTIRCELVNGSITVMGYEGSTVIIEAATRARKLSKGNKQSEKKGGMFRIPVNSSSLTVEERDNRLEIETSSHLRAVDITLQVPRKANLIISTVNSGKIEVTDVEGEIEAENINGRVTLNNIAGSAVASTHNGNLKVSFTRITPGTPMSFASFNGSVDVTFPATLDANVMFQTERGEVYSDFPVEKVDKAQKIVENNREKDGRYRVRIENAFYGKIGKGGAEFKFTNYHGNIYLRKTQ